MKKLWMLLLLVALASLNMPAFADDSSDDSLEDLNSEIGSLTSKVNTLMKGPSVEIHGFVQQDVINDSTQSFNETVGDGTVQKTGTVAGDNGWTQYSLRNSRIDFLAQAVVDGWLTKGYIEADFLGFPQISEYKLYTQPTLRLRHAYVDMQNDGWEIMTGQWWSLFGWNMDYVLATVAEAPVMATLYERIPQVRVQKTLGSANDVQVQLAVSAEKPDQDISQMPTIDEGIRLVINSIKGRFCSSTGAAKLQPLSIGLSERNAMFVYEPGGGSDKLNQSVWGSAVAGDVLLPLMPASEGKDDPSIVLTAEGTIGAGDTLGFNGGGFGGVATTGTFATVAPTVSANGTFLDSGNGAMINGQLQLLQVSSMNGQIQVFLPPSIGTILTAGYGEIFSSNAGTVGGTYNDDLNWFVNAMQDITPNIRAGLEYAQFTTHYTSGQQPWDDRVQFSTWYRF